MPWKNIKHAIGRAFNLLVALFTNPISSYVIIAIFVISMLYLAMHQVKTSPIP
jgi:hypothetical protein